MAMFSKIVRILTAVMAPSFLNPTLNLVAMASMEPKVKSSRLLKIHFTGRPVLFAMIALMHVGTIL